MGLQSCFFSIGELEERAPASGGSAGQDASGGSAGQDASGGSAGQAGGGGQAGAAGSGGTAGAAAKAALLVVGNSTPNPAGDASVETRLQTLGYTVTTLSDSAASISSADSASLILLSKTSDANVVGTKFRDLAKPVITWDPLLFDDLGLATGNGDHVANATVIQIQMPLHPLAAGLNNNVSIYASGDYVGFATPQPNALIIAVNPQNNTRSPLIAADTGMQLGAFSAPARRVALFLGTSGVSNLTPNGLKLFDAAVRWADP